MVDDVQDEKPKAPQIFHDDLDDFVDALECLYIKNNQSGRVQFLRQWGLAATALLGPVLIGFDTEGGGDLDQKLQAEDEAVIAQHKLLADIQALKNEIAENGFIAQEHFQEFIARWDRPIAQKILSPDILERGAQNARDNAVSRDNQAVDNGADARADDLLAQAQNIADQKREDDAWQEGDASQTSPAMAAERESQSVRFSSSHQTQDQLGNQAAAPLAEEPAENDQNYEFDDDGQRGKPAENPPQNPRQNPVKNSNVDNDVPVFTPMAASSAVSSPPPEALQANMAEMSKPERDVNLVQGSGELVERSILERNDEGANMTASRAKSSSALMAQRIVHARGFAQGKKPSGK